MVKRVTTIHQPKMRFQRYRVDFLFRRHIMRNVGNIKLKDLRCDIQTFHESNKVTVFYTETSSLEDFLIISMLVEQVQP